MNSLTFVTVAFALVHTPEPTFLCMCLAVCSFSDTQDCANMGCGSYMDECWCPQ